MMTRTKSKLQPAQKLVPNPQQNFKLEFVKVISRASRQKGFKWSAAEIEALTIDLKRCLAFKAAFEDPFSLSLPIKLDLCWHEVILETKMYRLFCESIGGFVDHSTASQDDLDDVKDARIAKLSGLYLEKFDDRSEWIWSKEIHHISEFGRDVIDPDFHRNHAQTRSSDERTF